MKELKRGLQGLSSEFENKFEALQKKQNQEDVHQLRVVVRRLLSALWVLKHSQKGLEPSGLSLKLKKLGKVLGRKRELDVALEEAKKYKLKTADIKALRKKSKQELALFLKEKKKKKILAALRLMIENIGVATAKSSLNPSAVHSKLMNQLQFWTEHSPHTTAELHRCRIQLKKARYVLEWLNCPVAPLVKAQNSLGKIHDLDLLGKYAPHDAHVSKDKHREMKKAEKLTEPALSFALTKIKKDSPPKVGRKSENAS